MVCYCIRALDWGLANAKISFLANTTKGHFSTPFSRPPYHHSIVLSAKLSQITFTLLPLHPIALLTIMIWISATSIIWDVAASSDWWTNCLVACHVSLEPRVAATTGARTKTQESHEVWVRTVIAVRKACRLTAAGVTSAKLSTHLSSEHPVPGPGHIVSEHCSVGIFRSGISH